MSEVIHSHNLPSRLALLYCIVPSHKFGAIVFYTHASISTVLNAITTQIVKCVSIYCLSSVVIISVEAINMNYDDCRE